MQEYDIKIVHIKGSDDYFADMLSRHPTGLSQESRDSNEAKGVIRGKVTFKN
jgi:hypothetical protein